MLLCGYEMMQIELAIYHILHHHRAAFRNVNVIFKGLERLESAGAFPPLSENGMPLSGARRCAWSRWDWPPGHLPGHHLPTLNKGSFAKAQHPLAAGLIPTPGPAAPGRKSGDRSSPPASWPCHQCKNMVTARSTRLDSIVTMLAAYPPRRWPCGPRLWKTRTDARRRLAALSGFPTGPHRG